MRNSRFRFCWACPRHATDAAPQGALGLGSNYYSANGNSQNTAMIFPKQLYLAFKSWAEVEGQTLQVGRFTFLGRKRDSRRRMRRSLRSSATASASACWATSDCPMWAAASTACTTRSRRPSDDFTFVAARSHARRVSDRRLGLESGSASATPRTRTSGARAGHAADTRFFVLEYDDWRHILKTDNRPTAIRKTDTENIASTPSAATPFTRSPPARALWMLLAWGAASDRALGHAAAARLRVRLRGRLSAEDSAASSSPGYAADSPKARATAIRMTT